MPRDRAGNRLSQARQVILDSRISNFRDALGSADRDDFYKFRLNTRSSFNLSLTELKADLNVVLSNSSGQMIRQSAQNGNKNETIQTDLRPDTYFIRVFQQSGSTAYKLNLSAYPAAPNPLTRGVDLTGSLFKTDTRFTANQTEISIDYTLQNQGREGSSRFDVSFYLSADSTITTSDKFLGRAELSSLASDSRISGTQNLTLPDSSDAFWSSGKTYYLGIVIDPAGSIAEPNKANNIKAIGGIDIHDTAAHNTTPAAFKIQFDYRFDTNHWFTPERKAVLEAAANVWQNIIKDEFADRSADTKLTVVNPQTNRYESDLTLGYNLDDLVVFVGASSLGGAVGYGGAFEWEVKDASFEPWAGSIGFDADIDWFFDAVAAPPAQKIDFFSVAVHELGHVLGIGGFDEVFLSQTSGNTFIGANAIAQNNGNPIPLDEHNAHIAENFIANHVLTETAMDPFLTPGTRKLPNSLDIAILDDIGYVVSYKTAHDRPS